MRLGYIFTILTISLLTITDANAHARWENSTITPRSDSSGIKSGPCGPAQNDPLPLPKDFLPGATINVQWKETIDHEGKFYIFFSANDEAGLPASPADLTDPAFAGAKLFEVVDPNNTVPEIYNADITLPMTTCQDCTLQLVQEMVTGTGSSNYYSCADIRITNSPVDPLDGSVIQGVYDDFSELDLDDDDHLNFQEISDGITISQDQFDVLDTNDDSLVSKAELTAAGASSSENEDEDEDENENEGTNGGGNDDDDAAAASLGVWFLVLLFCLVVLVRPPPFVRPRIMGVRKSKR